MLDDRKLKIQALCYMGEKYYKKTQEYLDALEEELKAEFHYVDKDVIFEIVHDEMYGQEELNLKRILKTIKERVNK